MAICRSSDLSSLFSRLVNPLLCLIMIFAILYLGQEILKPLAFSSFIALLLIGPSRFFERQGFPRAVAALICLLLALLVFIVIFYFISNSIASFRSDLPLMIQNIDQSINQFELWIQKTFHASSEEVHQIVANSTDKVLPSTSSI
ncbi:MAG: AI-2E family transporter, partial [Cytophagaceae bacterium]